MNINQKVYYYVPSLFIDYFVYFVNWGVSACRDKSVIGGFDDLPGSVSVLRTPRDVKSFGEKFSGKYKGSIDIEGHTIKSLSALQNRLTEIEGALILNSSSLKGVDGLSNLRKVDQSFILGKESGITDFSGLKSFQTIGADFVINAPSLGFPGFSSLDTIHGTFSGTVESFHGLSHLKCVGKMRFTYLSGDINFRDMKELDSCNEIVISTQDYKSLVIPDLDGLDHIHYLDKLDLTRVKVKTLTGLLNLRRVEDFRVGYIETFMGLMNLDSIGTFEMEEDSPDQLCPISNFDEYFGTVHGVGSFSIVSGSSESIPSCYPNLTLYGLSHIRYINHLRLINLPKITSLFELNNCRPNSNVADAVSIEIQNCSNLKNFCDLSSFVKNMPEKADFSIENNGYNPSKADILDNGKCSAD